MTAPLTTTRPPLPLAVLQQFRVIDGTLASMPEVALTAWHVNLFELIRHLPGRSDTFASRPLADMLRPPE